MARQYPTSDQLDRRQCYYLQMNIKSRGLLSLFIIFLVTFSLLLAGLTDAFRADKPTFGKAEVAYWTQAILTLLTIGVAIYVLRAQSNHAVRLMVAADERNLRRRVDSVSAILEEACRQLDNVRDITRGDQHKSIGIERVRPPNPADDRMYAVMALNNFRGKPQFEQILRVIDAIPVHEIGSKKMVLALFDVRNALVQLDLHLLTAWQEGEDKFSEPSLWNGTNVWTMIARAGKQTFDDASAHLFD
jgi:hypothetical protein